MDNLRDKVNWSYDFIRDRIFIETEKNPEISHEGFIWLARIIHKCKLERLLFDCSENDHSPGVEISIAAGFNKDGRIPPTLLNYLGFDKVVVGTVTADPCEGNSKRPRIWRFPKTNSMVNYLGLPGEGAEKIAENLSRYGEHGVPLTISLMSTPGKTRDAALNDIRKTVGIMRDVYNVSGFQFNGSCPNTPEAENTFEAYLQCIRGEAYPYQTTEIKISPDTGEEEAEKIVTIGTKEGIRGIVTANTTEKHDPTYIPNSPGKGGASGQAVYDSSFAVQRMIESKLDEIDSDIEITAVGGIDSEYKARERTSSPRVKRIEVYTGLIFKGPKLLEELRMAA